MRLIDADKLKEELSYKSPAPDFDIDSVILGVIDEQPTVDAVPVVHGYWVTETVRGDYVPCCSECGLENGTIYEYNYCPNCGARMDEERREG